MEAFINKVYAGTVWALRYMSMRQKKNILKSIIEWIKK